MPSEVPVHPPPVQVSSRVALLECFTVHPPPGHEKMQLLIVPSQTKSHPAPTHDFVQTSPGPVHVHPPVHVPFGASAAASPIDPSAFAPLSESTEPLEDEPEDDDEPEEDEELEEEDDEPEAPGLSSDEHAALTATVAAS